MTLILCNIALGLDQSLSICFGNVTSSLIRETRHIHGGIDGFMFSFVIMLLWRAA
jgi:hypothetical protein